MTRTFIYSFAPPSLDPSPGATIALDVSEIEDAGIREVLTSHWESQRRSAPNLSVFDDTDYQYLIGTDDAGEGYFLIWDNGGPVGSLDLETYRTVVNEAKRAGIKTPYHVYARYETYQSPNVRFWKIPDRILAHLGLNENDEFNNPEEVA